MEAERFDDFARALPRALPRRLAVGGGLAAALAALLAGGAEEAAAKNKNKKRKKRRKKCKKTCNSSNACEAASCNNKGKCTISDQPDGRDCGFEQACCGGQCRDLAEDPENCGACDVVCPSGECLGGTCTCEDLVCPDICNGCFSRLNLQKVCAAGTDQLVFCDSDDDCPAFGSFCVDNEFVAQCSIPCGELP